MLLLRLNYTYQYIQIYNIIKHFQVRRSCDILMCIMKSVFFIPVWNQIEELPRLLSELKSEPLPCTTVLFVNNGSNDGSEKLIHESGFEFIDLPRNLGIGFSFIKATDWAIERNYEIFGVLAGNGKMLPKEMSRVLDPVVKGTTDYVTGSRFLPGGAYPNLPLFRRISIRLVNLFVFLFTGKMLTDATCGYRAYRLEMFKRTEFDWHAEWLNTYGFEYYLYPKVILDRKIRWMEVPITMRYPQKGRRYSKIRPFSGWYAMLKPWLVARLDGKGFKS